MDDKSQTHYWGIVVKCHIVSHDRPATQDITGAGSMRSGGGRGEECKSTVDRRHEGRKKERKKERNSIKQLHQSRTAQYLLFSYCRDQRKQNAFSSLITRDLAVSVIFFRVFVFSKYFPIFSRFFKWGFALSACPVKRGSHFGNEKENNLCSCRTRVLISGEFQEKSPFFP